MTKKKLSIEVIAIGDEILKGTTINTNAAFIGKELLAKGYLVTTQQVLSDTHENMLQGLKIALERSQIILCTGGLGPTLDDNTRDIAASLFDSKMHFDEEVYKELITRYGDKFPTLKNQATIPDKAIKIPNPVGTALGFIFEKDNSCLALMPGVPVEMEPMLKNHVIPYLTQRYKSEFYKEDVYLFNMIEGPVDKTLRELEKEFPLVQFGIYPSLGFLTVHLKGDSKQAEEQIKKAKEKLKSIYSENIFESPTGKIEDAIQALMIQKKYTLSLAESCTGGSLASVLTSVPGASKYFLGCVVAYSNALKEQILGVSTALLKEKGAVSPEVAEAMAEGVRKLTGSSYALAVTGVAGPDGGSPEKPLGTVWGAIASPDKKTYSFKIGMRGTRKMIIERSVNALLSELYKNIR
jgi:nicotinamide-nucleotide amidase